MKNKESKRVKIVGITESGDNIYFTLGNFIQAFHLQRLSKEHTKNK